MLDTGWSGSEILLLRGYWLGDGITQIYTKNLLNIRIANSQLFKFSVDRCYSVANYCCDTLIFSTIQ
jgi:hypothetical protein